MQSVKRWIEYAVKNFLKKYDLVLYNTVFLERARRIEIPVMSDYIRVSMLELVAHEIYERNIEGSVAELGVYRGEFARHINAAFPDRTLYLFDTFKGFDSGDMECDVRHRFTTEFGDFSGTSVDSVLERMKYRDRCVVKPGLFPDSLGTLEDRFSFVSLDADLYQPTLEGLKYFHPRLNRGGYIFVHDFARGVKSAVERYCDETGANFVPASDTWSTVVIKK